MIQVISPPHLLPASTSQFRNQMPVVNPANANCPGIAGVQQNTQGDKQFQFQDSYHIAQQDTNPTAGRSSKMTNKDFRAT